MRGFDVRHLSRGFLFIAVLACCLAVRGAAAPSVAGLVTTATGTISVRHEGATAPLAKGKSLYVSDQVTTGTNGKATILFDDGSHAKLSNSTTIEITPPASLRGGQQSLFRLIRGEVWARPREGKAVQTRSAIAGVIGTEIVLKVADDDTATLTVLEGSVDFFNEFGQVQVGESQQSVARPGAAPSAPTTVANAGLIIEWTLDLNRAVIPREKFFISLEIGRAHV